MDLAAARCDTLRPAATQYTASRCNTLQQTATHCNTTQQEHVDLSHNDKNNKQLCTIVSTANKTGMGEGQGRVDLSQ